MHSVTPGETAGDISDAGAFHRFVRDVEPTALRLLSSKGLSREDSEDIRQEAFLICWRRRAEIRRPKKYLQETIFRLLQARWRDKQLKNHYSFSEVRKTPEFVLALEHLFICLG